MFIDKIFNTITNIIENLFCRSKLILEKDLPNQPSYIRFLAPFFIEPKTGKNIEIPYVQLILGLIITVVSIFPFLVGGEYVVYILISIIILLSSTYLAIRFSYVTKEKSAITMCDVFVIQTVVYVLFVDYMYNDFLKTFYTKIYLPVLYPKYVLPFINAHRKLIQ